MHRSSIACTSTNKIFFGDVLSPALTHVSDTDPHSFGTKPQLHGPQVGNVLLAVPVLALSACGCAAYCALTWRHWLRRLGLPRSPLQAPPVPPCTRGQADGCAGDERGRGIAAGPLPGRQAEGWAGAGLAWEASTGLALDREAGGHGGERSRDASARPLHWRQADTCDRDGRGAGPRRWEQALGRAWQGHTWGEAGAACGYAGDAVAPYVLHWAAATAVAALVLHVQVATTCFL